MQSSLKPWTRSFILCMEMFPRCVQGVVLSGLQPAPCNYWHGDFSSKTWRWTRSDKEFPQLSSTSWKVPSGSWCEADCWVSTNLSSGWAQGGPAPAQCGVGMCTRTGLGLDSLSWAAQVPPLGCCLGTAWNCQRPALSSSFLISTVLL